ncbi:PKD domain-containing protein [Exilibacterium tricleocarpae]|nr:discoidin domain-containing protein [Exilibacterium tricleocarpae]
MKISLTKSLFSVLLCVASLPSASALDNVVSGKPVSTYFSVGTPAARAVDNNLANNSAWSSGLKKRAVELTIELNGFFEVSSAEFHVGKIVDGTPRFIPEVFELQYYDDYCWVPVENASFRGFAGDKAEASFAPVITDRLRYISVDPDGHNNLRELKVFGVSTDEPVLKTGHCETGGRVMVRGPLFDVARYLPEDYNTPDASGNPKKWPLVISMHGIGGQILDVARTRVLDDSGNNGIKGFHKQLLDVTDYPAIVLSPACHPNTDPCWFDPKNIPNAINQLTRKAIQEYAVDEDRVFITGLSGGGKRAIESAFIEPELYAGIAPIAYKQSQSNICQYTAFHVSAYGGNRDLRHPPTTWISTRNALNTTCGAGADEHFEVTVINGGNHSGSTWDTAYASAELQDFFITNTKLIQGNTKPVVDAGPDKTVYISQGSFTLQAAATDDGTITRTEWEQLSGPAIELLDTNTLTLRGSNIVLGEYVFRFTAFDEFNESGSDDVVVTVVDDPENMPPVIRLATQKTVELPATTVMLTAEVIDPDGILSMQWQQVSGGVVGLNGQQSEVLSVSGLQEGRYAFTLTATDSLGLSATAGIEVNVVRNVVWRNVAVTKPVTASATQAGGYRPEHITDGNIQPKAPTWASGKGNNRYIEVDLLQPYSLSRIVVHSGYNHTRFIMKNFDVRVYDGAAWVPVAGGEFSGGTNADYEVTLTFDESVVAQKVRLYCNNAYAENCVLREVELLTTDNISLNDTL